jgi:CRP-like cAMP-binding protein
MAACARLAHPVASRGVTTVRIIPFAPGRRPTDEARHPGLGSSDAVAFLEGDYYLLLAVSGGARCKLVVNGRTVVPARFAEDGSLEDSTLAEDRTYVVVLNDLDGEYTFPTLFSQVQDVRVELVRDGETVAEDATKLEVYDVAQMGSLYERIVERLVKPDTARQAPGLSHAYHPWFPVLLIGAHKAELYTRALVGDIVHKRRNLADPGWLVRVGLYLEFLTALGIVEAVKDDFGDLLSAEERAAFETSAAFAEIRARVNVDGWRGVWALRDIVTRGLPRSGPVSAMNLLAKRRATLEFLHVHHEDLQHAIELAGPNVDHAQETWHRVFRDAERAVLRQTPDAFPELGDLPPEVRRFVLWHRQGQLGLRRMLRVPGPLPKLLGDQDGLFGSACNQYRASMNHVAEWARERGLMDHTGEESVPRGVSLFEAHLNQPSRVTLLQRRDGYDSDHLEVGAELPTDYSPPLNVLAELLGNTMPFSILTADEIAQLARTARPQVFGPMERIIVQGQEGDSLFAVVEGTVEVLIRRDGGPDVHIGTRPRGTVVGEMSLLTGDPRSATVRAVDGALVYEVGRRQLQPLLTARPELFDALRGAMVSRLRTQESFLERYDAARCAKAFSRRFAKSDIA